VDIEDCLALIAFRGGTIDFKKLIERYRETAAYTISEEKVNRNLDFFLERARGGGS
jgi:hypothetical protein